MQEQDQKTLNRAEFEEKLKSLSSVDLRTVLLFMTALKFEQSGANDTSRAAVRQRLRIIEETWKPISLRLERGKARRGELCREDLASCESAFGIAPDWVLTGDTAALRRGYTEFFARRTAA